MVRDENRKMNMPISAGRHLLTEFSLPVIKTSLRKACLSAELTDGCATIQELLVYRSEVTEGPHMLCLFCGQSYRGSVRRQRRGLPNAYLSMTTSISPTGFPRSRRGKELVFFTNSEKNIAFYRKLCFEVFDIMRNMPGTLNSRHLLSYTYPSDFFSFPSSFF